MSPDRDRRRAPVLPSVLWWTVTVHGCSLDPAGLGGRAQCAVVDRHGAWLLTRSGSSPGQS
jgi:hypothetical protein